MNTYNLQCPVCHSEQITADVLRHDWMFYECANCDSEGEGPINTLASRIDNLAEATMEHKRRIRREQAIKHRRAHAR